MKNLICPKCKSKDIHENTYDHGWMISWNKCNNCNSDLLVEYELLVKNVKLQDDEKGVIK